LRRIASAVAVVLAGIRVADRAGIASTDAIASFGGSWQAFALWQFALSAYAGRRPQCRGHSR